MGWVLVVMGGLTGVFIRTGGPGCTRYTLLALVVPTSLGWWAPGTLLCQQLLLSPQLYVQARLCWKWARLLRPTVQFFLVAFAL